ncbi:putative Zn-dependent peptidase [Mariprofundus aestuarium]|uniref:Putative Zn-dependent peptidase n=1 Tax=Mariprofundus aestuarium TaxID=1921086 RepID=A0A2K8L3Y4_MARES|nr:pitrilysin family protein [Mariprofundus aestuarium]ATX80541.1 putative Zn-dependent peptidase [Mariprofundus aestuarium]
MSLDYYQETDLADGPLVLSHEMPESQSVALGIFIDVGSRDESPNEAGITHALEHMLFKGTKDLDVDRLAEKLDELGGNANAYTSRERTCFHLHVLHEHWREALDILIAMVQEPALPADEWVREREVIFAEMAMVEDTPEEWVTDQHVEGLFPGDVIGKPVLGSHDSLASIGIEDLSGFLMHWYRPPRMLVTAAGNIKHQDLVDAVGEANWRKAGEPLLRKQPPAMATGLQPLKREGGQAQLVVSVAGINASSEQRPVAWLANQVLGGGLSSRLFREVREKRGLAYSIGSHLNALSDVGTWSVTCGSEPERAAECVSLLSSLLNDFSDSITPDEVERARKQLEVQLRMGLDSVEGQMLYLGGRLDEPVLISPLQWLDQIRAVEVSEVSGWAAKYLSAGKLWTVAAPEQALDKICDRIRTC